MARVLTASALSAVLVVGGAPSAAAEETRPTLRMPFACGPDWFARTYRGHPTYAIDWNLNGGGNADYGQPVLAGAAGVVHVERHAGYGNMVVVDHGAGWTTLYAHLSRFDVVDGQRVAADTVLGLVGNTGRSDGSHLHQEQLLHGVRQQVVINGQPIVASYSSRGASFSNACAAPVVAQTAARLQWGPCRRAVVRFWSNRCGFAPRVQLP